MAPKNLLRHPQAKSGLWEFDDIPDDKVRQRSHWQPHACPLLGKALAACVCQCQTLNGLHASGAVAAG